MPVGVGHDYDYTVPKEIDFPRYTMKCSGENVILRGIFHVVSCFPLHFMLYCGNLDCFSNRVSQIQYILYTVCKKTDIVGYNFTCQEGLGFYTEI